MRSSNVYCISTREQYDSERARANQLINQLTEKELLTPDADNEEIRELGNILSAISDYEKDYMNVLPLKHRTPLIQSIETYSINNGLKRKDIAEMLGITESVFSQIMNGKRKISLSVAKKLYETMHIDADLILKYS